MITTIVGQVPAGLADAVSWASRAIAVLCVIPLCLSTLRGRTDPPPATWGVWAAAGVVGSAGMAIAGGDSAAWGLKLALSVGPLAVAVCARRAGVPWAVGRADKVSLALAGVGLVFLLFGEGLTAMWLSIAVNVIGTLPTLLHAWRAPFRARYFPFGCANVSVVGVLALAVPVPWTVASVAYPLYLWLDTALIMGTILVARYRVYAAARYRRDAAARGLNVARQHGEPLT